MQLQWGACITTRGKKYSYTWRQRLGLTSYLHRGNILVQITLEYINSKDFGCYVYSKYSHYESMS